MQCVQEIRIGAAARCEWNMGTLTRSREMDLSTECLGTLPTYRPAAAGDHGLRISPLVNTDRKGGAFPIMLQQFRRAIGVAIVRGNARHKLSRLHYVRTTPEEAAATCRANHSNNRWKQHQHGRTSWFSQHTPDGYRTYEQFRNGYDFCVP